MSLEGQKQSFLDDIRQLTSGCQLVVAENQLLRNRLKFLQCRRQGKVRPGAQLPGCSGSLSVASTCGCCLTGFMC